MISGPDIQRLKRFSGERWTRAIYVSLSNVRVAPLVEAGYLESRKDPDTFARGNAAIEYRLTVKGAAVTLADSASRVSN